MTPPILSYGVSKKIQWVYYGEHLILTGNTTKIPHVPSVVRMLWLLNVYLIDATLLCQCVPGTGLVSILLRKIV